MCSFGVASLSFLPKICKTASKDKIGLQFDWSILLSLHKVKINSTYTSFAKY